MVETMCLGEAVEVYKRALALRPSSTGALDALGEVLVSLDEREEAKGVFQRSVELSPALGFSKWMYLGQLSSGEEAAACFHSGMGLIRKELEGGSVAHSQDFLKRRLSEAYCSLVELYMTDLCDDPGAQEKCIEYSAASVQACDRNPEAHQVTASLLLVLQRPDDARVHLRRACALIKELEEAEDGEEEEEEGGEKEEEEEEEEEEEPLSEGGKGGSSKSGMEEGEESAGAGASGSAGSTPPTVAAVDVMPSQEFRMHTARMCMEAELYPEAGHLLNVLLAEDDTDMETWFLAGEAALLAGDVGHALDVLGTADAMLGAALAAGGRKGGGRDAQRATSAAASATSVIDFSPEAIAALLATPPGALAEQQTMTRALLEKALEAAAASKKGGSGSGSGSGSGRGMEEQ